MALTWTVCRQSVALLGLAAILGLSVNLMRPDGLSVTEECFKNNILPVGTNQPSVVTLEEAKRLFEGHRAVFIDVRPAEEYAWGHIQGAVNVPWEEFSQGRTRLFDQYGPDTPLLIYSDGVSCGRSAALAVALYDRGYREIRILINGWSLWQENQLPSEFGSSLF